MKKRFCVLSLVLIFIMLFSLISISAQGNEKIILDNNLFYAEMPDGFKADTTITDNYYFEDEDYTLVEFYVQGNLQFPDGIQKTPAEVIGRRVLRIIENDTTGVSLDRVDKLKINGFNAACVYGKVDDLFDGFFKAYVFATKETVFVVSCQGWEENQLSALDAVIVNFTVNGTYFPGDKPTIEHDFSKSEDYYTAYERNSEEYYRNKQKEDKETMVFAAFMIVLIFITPVILILLIVIIVKYRKYKKLSKEYEGYFGSINIVRNQFRMYNYGQNPYVPQMQYNPQPMGYQQYPQPVNPQEQVINQSKNNIEK